MVVASCGWDTVAHRQHERDANRIIVLLREAGVRAEKVRDEESRELRFDVTVASADAPRALALLEDHDLPKPPQPSSRDLVEASGVIPTEREERMKQVVGLEGDIVNALREVPGIIDARAAVSVPRADPMLEPGARPRPKASVLVIWRSEQGAPLAVADVQRFVQAKLPELSASEVDVVLVPAPASSVGPTGLDRAGCRPAPLFGVEVCAESRARLGAMLIGTLGAAVVSAALAWWMALRSARARRRLASPNPEPKPEPKPGRGLERRISTPEGEPSP